MMPGMLLTFRSFFAASEPVTVLSSALSSTISDI